MYSTRSLTTVKLSFFKVGMNSTFSTASPDDAFNSRVSASKALSAEVSLLASIKMIRRWQDTNLSQ